MVWPLDAHKGHPIPTSAQISYKTEQQIRSLLLFSSSASDIFSLELKFGFQPKVAESMGC